MSNQTSGPVLAYDAAPRREPLYVAALVALVASLTVPLAYTLLHNAGIVPWSTPSSPPWDWGSQPWGATNLTLVEARRLLYFYDVLDLFLPTFLMLPVIWILSWRCRRGGMGRAASLCRAAGWIILGWFVLVCFSIAQQR